MDISIIKNILKPKVNYVLSSLVATSVDYLIFFALVAISTNNFIPFIQAFAYACGVLVNFVLRKKFVFTLKRSVSLTLSLSIAFSLFGMLISSVLIFLLTQLDYFIQYLIITKLLISAILMVYNFYANRFAFEKKSPFQGLNEDPASENIDKD